MTAQAPVAVDTRTGNQTFRRDSYHGAPTNTTSQIIQQSIAGAARAPTGEVHIRGQHAEYTYYIDGVPVLPGISGSLNEFFDPAVVDQTRVSDRRLGRRVRQQERGDRRREHSNPGGRIPVRGLGISAARSTRTDRGCHSAIPERASRAGSRGHPPGDRHAAGAGRGRSLTHRDRSTSTIDGDDSSTFRQGCSSPRRATMSSSSTSAGRRRSSRCRTTRPAGGSRRPPEGHSTLSSTSAGGTSFREERKPESAPTCSSVFARHGSLDYTPGRRRPVVHLLPGLDPVQPQRGSQLRAPTASRSTSAFERATTSSSRSARSPRSRPGTRTS